MAEQISYLQRIQACLLDGRTSHLDDEDIAYFVGRALGLTPEQLQQPVGSLRVIAWPPTGDMVQAAADELAPYCDRPADYEQVVAQACDALDAAFAARPGAKEGGA
ncbi:hypothetical protein [Pseudoroseomonas cervicalis]|uniref:hypothetical protein n=1 Tax=Teichococcus cervicalis TaxID=204525 RepID=UPI00278A2E65|nr:hypothetical protein [Pseudoroseomonas cervicalis]MDQ1077962.1 hypothetical protein [Pseudoroseomonas cervicalis]